MEARVLRGELPRIYQALRKSLVFRQALEFAFPVEIRPAVADVRDDKVQPQRGRDGERCTHARREPMAFGVISQCLLDLFKAILLPAHDFLEPLVARPHDTIGRTHDEIEKSPY